jgi:CheY-like chemotaxis protein
VDLAGLRILAVDDQPDALELIRRVLGECLAEVHAVGSAEEALAAINGFRPDLLISDIGMPENDGYALIQEVRKRIDGNSLPAIALTAFAGPEHQRRSLSAGYQMHITKPVDPQELSAAIAKLARRNGISA